MKLICDLSFWNILNDTFIWKLAYCVLVFDTDSFVFILFFLYTSSRPVVDKLIGNVSYVICFMLQ